MRIRRRPPFRGFAALAERGIQPIRADDTPGQAVDAAVRSLRQVLSRFRGEGQFGVPAPAESPIPVDRKLSANS